MPWCYITAVKTLNILQSRHLLEGQRHEHNSSNLQVPVSQSFRLNKSLPEFFYIPGDKNAVLLHEYSSYTTAAECIGMTAVHTRIEMNKRVYEQTHAWAVIFQIFMT